MSDESEANVVDLTAAVRELSEGLVTVRDSQKKVKRLMRVGAVSLAIDLLLTVFVGGLTHRVEQNANTIRAVQCSFYELVLGNYHPETRKVGTDRDTYVAQFATIRADAARLHCGRS